MGGRFDELKGRFWWREWLLGGWGLVVLGVGWWVGCVGEGDFVAVGVFGHFAGVGYAMWVGWLRELMVLVLRLVHVRPVWSGSVAMREDAGFLAHV